MEAIWNFGIDLVRSIQGLGGWLEIPMKFFSFLGTEDFFMLVLPVLFWCIDIGLGIRVAFMLLIGSTVNDTFKLILHGPRPYWYSTQVKAYAGETGFGVPSGHSQSAVSIWGMLAVGLRRKWGWIVAGLIAFFIGFSRMYLGVHFPHDVLAGWLLGALMLWLVVRCWDPVVAWLKKRTVWQQILVGLGFSLVLILPSVLTSLWLQANWQIPQFWVDNAAAALPEGPLPAPLSLEGLVSNAGTIFGLSLGLIWLARMGWFETKGVWWKLVLRFLLGVAGVLVIRYGLKVIFPEGETLLALSFRYLRYTLIGAWVAGGAPWAFLRLKLATKAVK